MIEGPGLVMAGLRARDHPMGHASINLSVGPTQLSVVKDALFGGLARVDVPAAGLAGERCLHGVWRYTDGSGDQRDTFSPGFGWARGQDCGGRVDGLCGWPRGNETVNHLGPQWGGVVEDLGWSEGLISDRCPKG